jgi:AraC-like DNA-binding protein
MYVPDFKPVRCSTDHLSARNRIPAWRDFFGLWLQRAELAPLLDGLDEAALRRRVTPDSAVLQYLVGYARFLDGQQELADGGLARAAAAHVRDLLVLLLGASGGAAVDAEGRGPRAARLRAIKRYVADNLGHRGLTVGAVAARHRVAPRYVQRLFAREGTTFSEYVLNERLARAFRVLIDPANVERTVSDVALDAGFGDVSYFNRRFRRRYGVRPSDVRPAEPLEA